MRTRDIQRDQEIVRLYRAGGFTTAHIAKSFGLSRGYVLSIVKRYGASRSQAEGNRVAAPLKSRKRIRGKKNMTPTKKRAKSYDNQLLQLRDIVIGLMKEEGRDFRTCEYCGDAIPAGKFQLHHMKYDGATYHDLMIVCQPCNVRPENRYLD